MNKESMEFIDRKQHFYIVVIEWCQSNDYI